MKKLLLTALLFAGIATTGFSQAGPRQERTPEQRAQMMTEGLAKRLTLTDQQKSEVYKINLDRANQMTKFRELSQEDRKKEMSKMKELSDASEAKILALLTDDQKKAFKEMQEKRKEHGQRMGGEKKKRPDAQPEAGAGE